MSTAPIFLEPSSDPPLRVVPETSIEMPDRVNRLEDEVSELRDTIARFADLMIGEVKDLRKSSAELPELPPHIAGELPTIPETDAAAPRRPWLLMEMLRDFGATIRMYLDPRYRVRRSTQIMVPAILALFAINCYFFNMVMLIPVVSSILEKLADIVLAILLYKVITREVARYRLVISQLVAWQGYRVNRRRAVVGGEPAMTRVEMD